MYENGEKPMVQNINPGGGGGNNQDWLWAWLLTGGRYGAGGFGKYGGAGMGGYPNYEHRKSETDSVLASINGLGNTLAANTQAAQTDSIKDSVREVQNLFTNLTHSSEIADCNRHTAILAAIQDCCCRTQESINRISSEICALGNSMNMQFTQLGNSMNTQFANASNERCNNTRDILEAVRNDGDATRALINSNTVKELEQKLADAQRREQTQTIIAEIKADCDNGGWWGRSGGRSQGGFVPPGQSN